MLNMKSKPRLGRPRKVRFKISSAYSGRVLKQVFEDGQELDSCQVSAVAPLGPAAESPARHWGQQPRTEPRSNRALLVRPGFKGICTSLPHTCCALLTANGNTDKILLQPSPVLDFGKIIIYTNNLKIIRAPMDQKELMRRIIQTEGINDWAFIYQEKKERFGGGHRKDVEKKVACIVPEKLFNLGREEDDEHGCSQCKGSGSAPCSLCHGSKFSMLANRFRESYRALRCPACKESGLQPCHICAA
uniref:Uncharacterized protein n=1 Tax=Melopsittacus undulatus TaxID=13146 RepID=A0A8C6IWQ0_MELUD